MQNRWSKGPRAASTMASYRVASYRVVEFLICIFIMRSIRLSINRKEQILVWGLLIVTILCSISAWQLYSNVRQGSTNRQVWRPIDSNREQIFGRTGLARSSISLTFRSWTDRFWPVDPWFKEKNWTRDPFDRFRTKYFTWFSYHWSAILWNRILTEASKSPSDAETM